ncbi:MAG: sodium-independent anion transporter, partial [Phototrophicales bacterium]
MTGHTLNLSFMNPKRHVSLHNYFPFLNWLLNYRRENLTGDMIAGVIVAVMLVPQGMAYAMLAGLPPQVGLYASIAPLFIYGLLGTSTALAVGPVAVMSILTASAIESIGADSLEAMLSISITLALMIGLIQMLMGILRVGFLVNFLSHPVLAGFTSAVAIIIALSQLKHLLGIQIPREKLPHEIVIYAVQHFSETNITVLVLSLLSIGILIFFKKYLKFFLKRLSISE